MEIAFDRHVVLTAAAFLLVTAAPVITAAVHHRRLSRLLERCSEAWTLLSGELAVRHGLVPELVDFIRARFPEARSLERRLVEARHAAMAPVESLEERTAAESALAQTLRAAFEAIAKSPAATETSYKRILEGFAGNEDRLQAAQRFHSVNVRDFNTRIERFPYSSVAAWFGFAAEPDFLIEPCGASRPHQAGVWSTSERAPVFGVMAAGAARQFSRSKAHRADDRV